MKIKKLYESNKDLAKEFKKIINEKFFIGLEEFDDIVIKYDDHMVIFKICFSSIFKETVQSIEKFEIFMGYSGWAFETEIVNDHSFDYARIYYEFHLDSHSLNMYMEKFRLEIDAKKYNL